MMKTDLHKKTGHTDAPHLKLDKKVRGESGKDNANLYCMPPKHWFLTFMYMNIPIAGWIYLICLAFGKKENQLRDFVEAYLICRLVFLVVTLIILGVLIYTRLNLVDELLTYIEML